jgi:hypothetical protein
MFFLVVAFFSATTNFGYNVKHTNKDKQTDEDIDSNGLDKLRLGFFGVVLLL